METVNGRFAIKAVFLLILFFSFLLDSQFLFQIKKYEKISDSEKLKVNVEYVPIVKSVLEIQKEEIEKLRIRRIPESRKLEDFVISDRTGMRWKF